MKTPFNLTNADQKSLETVISIAIVGIWDKLGILTLKAPPIICSRRRLQMLPLFFFKKKGMIFHENRLLADNSHVISHLNFVENWERCRKICRLLQS